MVSLLLFQRTILPRRFSSAARVTLLAVWLIAGTALAAEPQLVSFLGEKILLHGWIYKPPGDGPFPAMLYNHGSEERPGWKPQLGEFYTGNGANAGGGHCRGD